MSAQVEEKPEVTETSLRHVIIFHGEGEAPTELCLDTYICW